MTPDKKDKKKPSVSKTARIAKIVNKPKDAINEKILKIVFERKEISVPDLAIEVGLHTSNIGSGRIKSAGRSFRLLHFRYPRWL